VSGRILVDDSIVVLEKHCRHLQLGKTPFHARSMAREIAWRRSRSRWSRRVYVPCRDDERLPPSSCSHLPW